MARTSERKKDLIAQVRAAEKHAREIKYEIDDLEADLSMADDDDEVDAIQGELDRLEDDLVQTMQWVQDAKNELLMPEVSGLEVTESSELLKRYIAEIIHKCDDDHHWCLYTKHKGKNGKRRRLGKHSSLKGAQNQEKAIHSHGG